MANTTPTKRKQRTDYDIQVRATELSLRWDALIEQKGGQRPKGQPEYTARFVRAADYNRMQSKVLPADLHDIEDFLIVAPDILMGHTWHSYFIMEHRGSETIFTCEGGTLHSSCAIAVRLGYDTLAFIE